MIRELAAHVRNIFVSKGTLLGCQYFKNIEIKEICHQNNDHSSSNQNEAIKESKVTPTEYFLRRLLTTAERNASRSRNGFRFDADIKMYATYVRMFAGPKLYNFIHRNLEHALPSLPSANRYVQKTNCRVIEGIVRSEELIDFSKQRNIEPIVALSEDATRIVGRIQYDIKINQIIGFALPISEQNGVPIPFSYPGRSTNEIIDHFSLGNIPSSFVNVIMAKPITTQKTPSFCLLLYGTNNDYTSFDVCKRWEYVVSKLQSLGITVISVSSDSNPRYNSAMRKLSHLGKESTLFSNKSWLSCGDTTDSSMKEFPVYIQDSTHIGTKMRNLFLKTIEDLNYFRI